MKRQFARTIVLSVIAGALVCAGCGLDSETPTINNPALGITEENTILLCTDGLDNDKDGLIDCNDPGCQSMGTEEIPGPGKTVCTPTESTVYQCADGLDNDGNGYVDCQDNNCKKTSVCCIPTGAENQDDACSDGIDNDCNGYTDCQDNNCKKLSVCCVPSGDENTVDACSDGVDNDCDGYVDCGDYSCSGEKRGYDSIATQESKDYCESKNSVTESPENTEEKCADNRDNNLNGLIDCDDPDCAQTSYCMGAGEEPPARPANFASLPDVERGAILAHELYVCTDGIDNNRNGKADCDEYQCHLLSVRSQNYTGSDANYRFTCQMTPNQNGTGE